MKSVTIPMLCALFLAPISSQSNQALLYQKKPAFYSYIIGDAQGDQIYAEHASNVYATPASCQKTITALLALKSLGSDYCYTTSLSTTSKAGATDALILTFSGDPTLTSEQLTHLLEPFKNNHFAGGVILNASLFKLPPYSPNLMLDCVGAWYASPISSMGIDKNNIKITIIPKSAHVSSTVDYDLHVELTNTKEHSHVAIDWDCKAGEVIRVTGAVNKKNDPITITITPPTLVPYIIKKIRSVMDNLHITGDIRIISEEKLLPANMQFHSSTVSQPIKNIIPEALKTSDNFVFDSLFLTIIHANNKNITSWNDGDLIYKELLKKHFALDFENALFVDGSGLSRCNCVQPKKLFLLLQQGFSIPEFVNALARPGEQKSTLATRTKLPCSIRAKTGYIPGFSCLCGYDLNDNNPKAFVMMTSCFAPPLQELTDTVDTFLQETLGAY